MAKFKIPFVNRCRLNDEGRHLQNCDLLKTGEADLLFLEQFKALRSKMEYKADILGWKVIGVTSSIAGEGKTLVSAKIAACIAYTKRKTVLLVDGDIRKSGLTKGLQIPVQPGVTDFLLGSASFKVIVHHSGVPGLKVVSSGMPVPNPGYLLAGARFQVFIEEARKGFDIILVDTPPILAVADTLSIREMLDGFILLYRAGITPFPMFKQSTEEIGEKKLLGVVINGVTPRSNRYYNKYYGGYYNPSRKMEVTD